jgi:hypothetical protein
MSRGRGRDWAKQRVRAIQQRRGSESVTHSTAPQVQPQVNPTPRRRPSKAQLRAEAEQALAAWKTRRP